VDFPPWQTVYGWFQRWKERGVTERILNVLREQIRLAEGRDAELSAGVIYSQSVKAADTASRPLYIAQLRAVQQFVELMLGLLYKPVAFVRIERGVVLGELVERITDLVAVGLGHSRLAQIDLVVEHPSGHLVERTFGTVGESLQAAAQELGHARVVAGEVVHTLVHRG
jgi:hypothetical protein